MLDIHGYKTIRTEFPGLAAGKRLGGPKTIQKFFSRGSELGGNGRISCEMLDAGSKKKRLADCFIKATHVLEPVSYMKGEYEKNEDKRRHKIGEPMNQAYVDSLASAAVAKLRDAGLSPHFCELYGVYAATADKYYYNMSDEFEDFRGKRWFWANKERGLFDFKVFLGEEHEPIPEELKEYFEKPAEDELTDSEDETVDDSKKKKPLIGIDEDDDSSGIESLETLDIGEGAGATGAGPDVDAVSLKSFIFEEDESAMTDGNGGEDKDESDDENGEDDSEDSEDEIQIYAELPEFPVMLICMERNEDTMDNLLAEETFEGDWEKRWLAWTFQVVAALAQIQSTLDMTHNDLHTNNILWVPTAEPFLNYKSSDGQQWKVPTYGKLFRIIDFGRAIFKDEEGKQIYSDDFLTGNDAADQYNFGPFYNEKAPRIEPNRSFDLVRLATGLYEDLYEEEKPERKKGGRCLSREDGMEVWETESKLHDMLWTWLLDEEGRNVLIKPNGDERFPGFDLYQHIAAHCRGAVPAEQLRAASWFSAFRVEGKKAKAIKGKIYPIPL